MCHWFGLWTTVLEPLWPFKRQVTKHWSDHLSCELMLARLNRMMQWKQTPANYVLTYKKISLSRYLSHCDCNQGLDIRISLLMSHI